MINNKIKFSLVVFILSLGLRGFATEEEEDSSPKAPNRPNRTLSLTLGLEQDQKLPPIPKPFKSGGDCKTHNIAEVSYSEEINSLRFTPRREGLCTFTLKELKTGKIVAEYHIEVRKSKLDAVVREMQSLLGDIEGINIRIVNNKVVVDGQRPCQCSQANVA